MDTALAAGAALAILVISPARSEDPASEAGRKDKATYQAVCGSCHPTSLADGLRAEPEWKETIDAMIRLGARATDEQLVRVLRYLVRTQTKVNVNTATAQQIAPVLDISEASAEALVKSRTQTGGFRILEDLKKVPGVDARKIEARKDRIVFR